MNYNNPQHSQQYSCTPFPILKEGDTSNGIVTYLDLVSLGTIAGFGVDLTQFDSQAQRWDDKSITAWQTLFEAIDAHLKVFDAKIKLLESNANPNAIIITAKSGNQLEANTDVTWSSSSSDILVNPALGTSTIYSLANTATAYGSFTLSADKTSVDAGGTVRITATWNTSSKKYDSIITASKTGMTSATQSVSLYKDATCPSSVAITNNETAAGTITLTNNTGYIDLTNLSAGTYTIKTTGNETAGQISFTVNKPDIPQPTIKYYWYAGAGPINSSTTPGSGAGWTEVTGNPSQVATGELVSETKINWVLAIATKFGLNHISNGEDVTDAYDVTTVTCADGVEYKVFTQISQSKKTDRIFVA